MNTIDLIARPQPIEAKSQKRKPARKAKRSIAKIKARKKR